CRVRRRLPDAHRGYRQRRGAAGLCGARGARCVRGPPRCVRPGAGRRRLVMAPVMKARLRWAASLALLAASFIFRDALTRTMTLHMLAHIPMILLAGVLAGWAAGTGGGRSGGRRSG